MAKVFFIGGRVIDGTFHPDFHTAAPTRTKAERLLYITATADQGYVAKYEPTCTLAPCEYDVMMVEGNDDGTVEVVLA